MSLFLSTCSLISSSVGVITGVKQINAKVATILQPHKGLRVSESDRRRLVAIHKRVECLIQPLNFCVMWSKDKDSCIQPIIQYAYELVQSVTEFLDRVKFQTDELDPFTRVLESDSSKKVDHFLRELEFACTSVSMAVAITKSVSASSEFRQISPSALLKASIRISEMTCRSGDLFAISGTLYKRCSPTSDWTTLSTNCTFKISQFKSIDPLDSPYLIRLASESSVNLNFPIQTALSFKVTTVKSVSLPSPSIADSAAIYWSFSEGSPVAKRRLLHRNPSGEIDQDLSRLSLDSSDEETILVHGAADMPSSLRARVSSTHVGGPEIAAEFAFAYTASSSNLSPLDLVYIARLCVMEAVKQPAGPSVATGDYLPSPRGNVVQALHLEASDEALTALLMDAKLLPPPPEEDSPNSGPIDLVVNGEKDNQF